MDTEAQEEADGETGGRTLEDRLEPPRSTPGGRKLLGTGFMLVFCGLAVLVALGMHTLMTSPGIPIALQLGGGVVGFGLATSLGYLIRVRLRTPTPRAREEADR